MLHCILGCPAIFYSKIKFSGYGRGRTGRCLDLVQADKSIPELRDIFLRNNYWLPFILLMVSGEIVSNASGGL